ncbi:MAG: hypothetical protein MUF49_06035 [Oculatellaceae cyanobacterium Prado106]|jgi:hypothetical protein|nr:hypothetical protein [Oculatellaceae cyanobacterium Prado106]
MSDSVKEYIKEELTSKFNQVKSQGGTSAKRIVEILQNAMAESAKEVKNGSTEIGAIAKETLTTLASRLHDSEPDSNPNASTTTATNSTTATDSSTATKDVSLQSLVMSLFKTLKKWVLTQIDQKYTNVKQTASERVTDLGSQLQERYGDRYATTKQTTQQGWQKVETWYNTAKNRLETLDTEDLQQKQAEFRAKVDTAVGEAGSSVAKTEQAVRQQLKNVLQSNHR